MTEWHEGFRKQIEYCAYCPKLCRFACPVAQAECSETLTPTAKATVMKLVKDGALDFDEEVGELVYACNGCLITRTYCEHRIDAFPPLEAARAAAVEKGVAPSKVSEYAALWDKRKNPYNEDLAGIIRERTPAANVGNRARTVVFFGCVSPHYFPEQITDTALVLGAMDEDFTVFAEDMLCCGYPMLTLGMKDRFVEQAERVAKGLAGAELVLTPCPSCAHFLKTRYKEFHVELDARVMHLSEFLAENMDRAPLKKKLEGSPIYHDPCYLGRYLGVYDQPRKVLEALYGAPTMEFFEAREQATCCGGGGGVPVTRPETARKIASDKMSSIEEYEADLLVTTCPTCRRMLDRSDKGKGLVAQDLITLYARALEG